MIKSLRQARITDGLPRVLARQEWVIALSEALGLALGKTLDYTDESQIYTRLDTAPEAVLDVLAVDWKIDWYDTELTVEQKRRIVKTALTVRRLMGTAAAVKLQVHAIYPEAAVTEWFQYDGRPGCFRVSLPLPKEGITVESCIIGEWKKDVGDSVNVGDVLFSYETDKAEFDCESTAAGTLLAKFYEDGDEVPCLANVCAIGNPGDAFEFLKPGAEVPAPAAAPAAEEAAPAAVAAPAAAAEFKAISKRAMAKAVANNVNPALATGTGPNGRIIERDIDKLLASGAAAAYAAPTAAAPAAAEFEDVKWSPVRKATAKSMTKSLSTMAQLTQQYSFDATQIQAYRAMLKPLDAPMGKVSLNDMVMFAVAKTIKSCPDLNANVLEENVVRHFNTVNLGFACDTPRGLIVPTIFNADQMTLL